MAYLEELLPEFRKGAKDFLEEHDFWFNGIIINKNDITVEEI